MISDCRRPLVALARPVLRAMRECPVLLRAIRPGRAGRVVFLPAYGREGAALLRIYNVAAALRSQGGDVHVLPWKLTLSQRRRCLAALRPDVIVMQGTRHSLNRPALYPEQTIILDLDDGDFHLPHLAASVAEAMPQVAAVIAGSQYIADWCRRAGVPEARVVWTGAPVSGRTGLPHSDRSPVVAWAQTRPMDYRHETDLVRTVMRRVAERVPGTILRLYDRCVGDDPGFAQGFSAPGLTVQWYERKDYAGFLESLDDVAIGLAPLLEHDPFCRGKSFGKILAYLDRKVPVVASDAGEPQGFFSVETGSLCRTADEWVDSIVRLLSDRVARQRMADAGFVDFQRRLSVQSAADGVAKMLLEVVSRCAVNQSFDGHEADLNFT